MRELANRIRRLIITSTTKAGSGHPTSSLSAVDLMTVLFFGGFFRFRIHEPDYHNNDRFIVSKGHAAPLLYSLWAVAGAIPEESLMTLRDFGSNLEGHPTSAFAYSDAATGSLGHGLPIALGMALNAKHLDKLPYKTYVLLGDSEMAEGSNWEALQIAAHYKLDNLIGIIDINRLGQRGETMYGHDINAYKNRIDAFGWYCITVDGHDYENIRQTFEHIHHEAPTDKPIMILAKTIKGKGVPELEDKEGWHGKVLTEDQAKKALKDLEITSNELTHGLSSELTHDSGNELTSDFGNDSIRDLGNNPNRNYSAGLNDHNSESSNPNATPSRDPNATSSRDTDTTPKAVIAEPEDIPINLSQKKNNAKRHALMTIDNPSKGKPYATRKAYGDALVQLHSNHPNMVVLDAEVSNSTYAGTFKKAYPEKFFEMFIAEQNMVGVAVGMSARGKMPFVSTFASFLTRAADQIRVAQYGDANINFAGSHAGVSVGQDGASQMGLEDIALFRSVLNSTIVYPADRISAIRLTAKLADQDGICYIRTTRADTKALYRIDDEFHIGGSKVLRRSKADEITIIAAGITLYEALKAHSILARKNIKTRIIDLYSIKPIDEATLREAAQQTKALIIVEDHYKDGGIGDAVRQALTDRPTRIYSLAVSKIPMSGEPEELLDYEEISAKHIVKKVTDVLSAI